MRFLVALFLSIFSVSAFAGGSIAGSMIAYDGSGSLYPLIGMSVDERLAGKIFVNSWAGFGSRPDLEESKHWGALKLALEYRAKPVTVGLGTSMNISADSLNELFPQVTGGPKEKTAFVKVAYKLW